MSYTRNSVDTCQPRNPGSVWIDANRDKLSVNHWVAASVNGLVAEDPTYDGLVKKIDAAGLAGTEVAIAWISDPALAI